MLLTWATLFLWALRHVSSVPIPKDSSLSSPNRTLGLGIIQHVSIRIEEGGMAVRITTFEGEVQGFYKYHDGNATDPQPLNPVSTTNNDGTLNTNGTPTLIPMQKCPDPNQPSNFRQDALIHFIIIGIATYSRYDLETNTASLRSPCLPPMTTTTTTTTTAINPSDGSGKDLNQPGGIIHTLIWTTIIMTIDISHH